MPFGITDEHEELQQIARRWIEQYASPAILRTALDEEAATLPAFWPGLGEVGWLGLHIDEAWGGTGYGLTELAAVLEELGRAAAPGPFVPTVLVSAIVQAAGSDEVRATLLPELVAGETASVYLGAERVALSGAGASRTLRGVLSPILAGTVARYLLVPSTDGEAESWCVVDTRGAGIITTELASMDPTRRMASVEFADASVVATLEAGAGAAVEHLSAVILSAELVGLAQWCVETASEYAKVREQFGRPIGQFQGVKHKCADMLARTELARAAAWDAARAATDPADGPFTAAVAGALATAAATADAKDCVQVLGGIGFTWEHDAHIYLRRTTAMAGLLAGASTWRARAGALTLAGVRRRLAVDLPPEAEAHRPELRELISELKTLDKKDQRAFLADRGYVSPAWPKPWGRDASALEQLVIDEEFSAAKVRRPRLTIGAWALPNLIVYGTPEQQQRWIVPSLRGEIEWCQLFSEPGAGSDLAALTTKAQRTEGGWLINGQKVWTSMAQTAEWGILLARTDPEAPKHDGITCFMLDMKNSDGIDVRPLRELTGHAMFNEVFLNDVFIPDDCVVGAVNDGWRAARTTLANERVFMGGASTMGFGLESAAALLRDLGRQHDALALDEFGGLVAEAHALGVLGFRMTLQALAGANPSGSEASVRKLLGVLHDQHVQEFGLGLLDAAATVNDGAGAMWINGFLFNRALTIAGGTSEVQRNIIGERVLGLPRDP